MADFKLPRFNKAALPITISSDAVPENFAAVQEKVRELLEPFSCSMRTLLELDMIVEEVFINIANYAYKDHKGLVRIDLSLAEDGRSLEMTFRDSGIPYDPLQKETPDLSSPAEQRAIGGLGIFLVQKYSDSLSYHYIDGENRLTIRKKLC